MASAPDARAAWALLARHWRGHVGTRPAGECNGPLGPSAGRAFGRDMGGAAAPLVGYGGVRRLPPGGLPLSLVDRLPCHRNSPAPALAVRLRVPCCSPHVSILPAKATPGATPSTRTAKIVPTSREVAHPKRRTYHLCQTQRRLDPHPHRQTARSPDLVGTACSTTTLFRDRRLIS